MYRSRFFPTQRLLIPCAIFIAVFLGAWWTLSERRAGLEREIDALVEKAMEEGPIAGLSVAVARSGRLVHLKGYGYADLENGIPASDKTIYHVGSITKQFTAAAVMQLVEKGALALDRPITDYIPDYPTHGHSVTVRSILNHTSGIKNFTAMPSWWRTMAVEKTPEEMVDVFRNEPFDFPPGTAFSYSNSGYIVLGFLIERVTGKPYGGYLNENLFVPLQLSSTSYADDRALVRHRARGYKLAERSFVNADYVSQSQAYAAGAVCSSAQDLVRWMHALGHGGVVSPESYARMIQPGTLANGSSVEYGFGLAVSYLEQHHRINHVGGTLGFAGQISYYYDDDVTIVVLSNTEGAKVANIESDIARLMLGLGNRTVKDILLAPEELKQYSGVYEVKPGEVEIKPANGRLEVDLAVPGVGGRYVLLNQGKNVFHVESDSEISLRFALEDGVAKRFVLSYKGITMHGTRTRQGS